MSLTMFYLLGETFALFSAFKFTFMEEDTKLTIIV